MPITRLGLSNPAANTDTALVTFSSPHLISVIATSKAVTALPATKVSIWVAPANSVQASQFAYISYNLQISMGGAFETFRFAVNAGDTLYVRSTVDTTSFSCSGIVQEDSALPENLAQVFTNKVIRGIDNTVYLDKGATAERPAGAEVGYVRFNTETNHLEVKGNVDWANVGAAEGAVGPTGPAGADGSATAYTPTTSADWDVAPTTIAEALDELAARLRILEP